MDRFEDMRCFVQLAEQGSITRAAESLSLAPSAVSRRLRDLEARLGAQLVTRSTRRMSLTETGQQFLSRCRQILGDLDEAEAEAAHREQGLTGLLRLTAPLSFGLTHLAPMITEFIAAYPGLRVDLDLSDRQVDLVGEGFDLALRIGTLRDSRLMARRLCDVRLLACAAPAFLEAHGEPEGPQALRALPALCYAGSERPDIWRYREDGADASVQVPMRMRANNGDVLCAAAAAGLGVVLQPSFHVHRLLAEGTLRPILTDTHWAGVSIWLVYPQTRHVAARSRAFMDFARARIGAVPPWEAGLAPAPGSPG